MRLFLLVWREVGGVEKGLIRGGAKTRSVRESRLAVALEEFSQCNLVVYKRRRGIHVQRSDGSCQPLQLLQSSLIAFTAATVGRASSTSPKRTDPTEIEPSDGGENAIAFCCCPTSIFRTPSCYCCCCQLHSFPSPSCAEPKDRVVIGQGEKRVVGVQERNKKSQRPINLSKGTPSLSFFFVIRRAGTMWVTAFTSSSHAARKMCRVGLVVARFHKEKGRGRRRRTTKRVTTFCRLPR